jgi:TatD DNase family protein
MPFCEHICNPAFYLTICTMNLIDTHTHLYLPQFNSDRAEMIGRARAFGISRFYMPGIDTTVWDSLMQTHAQFPECLPMPGLHPCSVKGDYKTELDFVEECLAKGPWPALGEIGLDFYWDKTFTEEQYEAFRIQIEWALEYKLPIVIHTRNAMPETIAVVNEYKGRGLRGIFHCFTDSYDRACQIIDAGFLLGIGGVVTYKNSGLAEALSKVPLEHLVLETDSPYLTPVPFRGKRNESSYLQYVVQKLSEVYGLSAEEIATVTSANAQRLFAY